MPIKLSKNIKIGCKSDRINRHHNKDSRFNAFMIMVNPITLTYCNTKQDAHREDKN
jgi:hypothetical protein